MELDDLDRALVRLLVEDASRSHRALAREADSTAPTVAKRIERLRDLGLLKGIRAEVDLARLGTLVLVLAPGEEADALIAYEACFQVHRTQQNRVAALLLLRDLDALADVHRSFPRAETHVLTEWLHSDTPPVDGRVAAVDCSECGKRVGPDAIGLTLGGRHYVACCATCEARLRERYAKHA